MKCYWVYSSFFAWGFSDSKKCLCCLYMFHQEACDYLMCSGLDFLVFSHKSYFPAFSLHCGPAPSSYAAMLCMSPRLNRMCWKKGMMKSGVQKSLVLGVGLAEEQHASGGGHLLPALPDRLSLVSCGHFSGWLSYESSHASHSPHLLATQLQCGSHLNTTCWFLCL